MEVPFSNWNNPQVASKTTLVYTKLILLCTFLPN